MKDISRGALVALAALATAVSVIAAKDSAAAASYDTAALQGIASQIDADQMPTGTSWGVDPATNVVEVSYDSTVTDHELAAIRTLTEPFGDAIQLTPLPGTIEKAIGGGVAIFPETSTGVDDGRCSLGFNARKDGHYYFFTAGHCTNSSVWWYEHPYRNGQLGFRVTSMFPSRDIGIVKYSDSSIPKPGVIARFDGTVQDITHSRDAQQGEFVCKSGSTTGYTCGRVTKPLTYVKYPEGTVYGVTETTACARRGDSGGPLHSGEAALGILSGGNVRAPCSQQRTYFERVREFEAIHGIRVY